MGYTKSIKLVLNCHHPNDNTTQPQHCSWVGHENENVSLCWHYSNGECPFGDESCWFKHEINKENDNQSELKSIKCNICGNILKNKNEFMTHRKTNHEEIIKICNLFKKGQCTYHEKCWVGHRTIEIDGKTIKETTDNHNKTQQ